MADGSTSQCKGQAPNITLDLQDYQAKKQKFDVLHLNKYDAILGKPWLWDANPEIDWRTNQIKVKQYTLQGVSQSTTSPEELNTLIHRPAKQPSRKTHDDLGEWPQPHDEIYQAIAGHYCYWHRERAYDHHIHHLVNKNKKEDERTFTAKYKRQDEPEPLPVPTKFYIAYTRDTEWDSDPIVDPEAEWPLEVSCLSPQEPAIETKMISRQQLAKTGEENSELFAVFANSPAKSSPEIPAKAIDLIHEFWDVFPEDLPSGLPPSRAVDHKIELYEG